MQKENKDLSLSTLFEEGVKDYQKDIEKMLYDCSELCFLCGFNKTLYALSTSLAFLTVQKVCWLNGIGTNLTAEQQYRVRF